MDDRVVGDLVDELRRVTSAKRDIARALATAGLTLPSGSAALLAELESAPRRVGDLALAGRCHLSVASRLVAELEAHGMVAKETDPDDGRSHRVVLTPAGQDYLRRHRHQVGDLIGRALDGWTETELESLTRGIARLAAGMDRALSGSAVTV